MKKDYKEQMRIDLKREERVQRQLDIAEAAANEDRDRRETDLRERLMLNKLWVSFLTTKYERSTANSVYIVKAFNEIRLATGTYEIENIVEKFLTREQSFMQLRDMISDANEKCDYYRLKI